MSFNIFLNFSLSSAASIDSEEVPITGTPNLVKSLTNFNGVCRIER